MNKVVELDTFEASLDGLSVTDRGHAYDLIRKLRSGSGDHSVLLRHLEGVNDPKIWYGRVTQEMRVIVWLDGNTYYLLYAGRHDASFEWVKRRRIDRHRITGALQMVIATHALEHRIAETPLAPTAQPLLAAHADDYLLALGLPDEWLPRLREHTERDAFLDTLIAAEVPGDVQDRLLDLLEGKVVAPAPVIAPDEPPELYPETCGRFTVLDGGDAELEQLFMAPRPVWVKYLHPTQAYLVDAAFRGPARVSGSAGTGKSVVAIHRARRLAREGRHVLFTTYVHTLPPEIRENLALLCAPDELGRIDVRTVHSAAGSLLAKAHDHWDALDDRAWLARVREAAHATDCPFDAPFVAAELDAVIEAQGLTRWEDYRKAPRRGRGVPLSVVDRKKIWDAVAHLRGRCEMRRETTYAGLCARATMLLQEERSASPYDAVIVDEVQDLGPQELRFVAALAGTGPDALCVVGDVGQRLYRRAVSLRACGIETRGRSHVLRVNYRTTHQIRRFADALLGEVRDADDDDDRSGRHARSVMRGPEPLWRGFETTDAQDAAVADAIRVFATARDGAGPMPYGEIAVFAPSGERAKRVERALRAAGIPTRLLHETGRKDGTARVSVGTIHRAKGLEYRAVITVDASESAINVRSPEGEMPDPRDREDADRRARQLLYVSLTRARNELHIYWVGEPCGFLLDAITAP